MAQLAATRSAVNKKTRSTQRHPGRHFGHWQLHMQLGQQLFDGRMILVL